MPRPPFSILGLAVTASLVGVAPLGAEPVSGAKVNSTVESFTSPEDTGPSEGMLPSDHRVADPGEPRPKPKPHPRPRPRSPAAKPTLAAPSAAPGDRRR